MFIEEVPDTHFNRQLAIGHERRLGHKLNAKHVSADGILWHKIYLCCGEELPESVKSWEDMTPRPDKTQEEKKTYGACGVEDCKDCLPLFDAANNPIGEETQEDSTTQEEK